MAVNNNNINPVRSDIYFANLEADELPAALNNKIYDYQRFCYQRGLLSLWKRCYWQYYRALETLGITGRVGENQEYYTLTINDFRSIIKNVLTLVTSQRPAWECKSANTDTSVKSETIVGTTVLDYYMEKKRAERYLTDAAEIAMAWGGDAWVRVLWDPNAGELFDTIKNDDGTDKEVREGDLAFSTHTPLDVIRDVTKRSPYNHDWTIIRDYVNKWDLVAKYPALAEEIKMINPNPGSFQGYSSYFTMYRYDGFSSDLIPVYDFYHRKTDAVPQGRIFRYVTEDIVLADGPLPYDNIPAYRIHGGQQTNSIFGHTTSFELLAIQEAADVLDSTFLTNAATWGVGALTAPKGAGVEPSTLSGGQELYEYDSELGGKLEVLPSPQIDPALFNLRQQIGAGMERISGINPVVRGQIDQALGKNASGAALAMMNSLAIQYQNEFQSSWVQLLEDVGTAALKNLKTNANVPRVEAIAGKSNKKYVENFQKDMIKNLDRVTVNVGNPLTKTPSGRMQIAEIFLQYGIVKDPQQFFTMLDTGLFKPVSENPEAENMLISSENELLAQGKMIDALPLQNPFLHILENVSVLDNPEIAGNFNHPTTQAVIKHVQQHIDFYLQMSPALCAIFKIPSPQQIGIQPPGAMPPGMPPGAGAPPGGPMAQPAQPPGSPGPSGAPPAGTPSPASQDAGVSMPSLPKPPANADQASADIINSNRQNPSGV